MSDAAPLPGVLCVGRLYCDLVFTGLPGLPVMGRELYADGLSLHAGGGAPITAGYLAGLGRPAHLAALLPAAPFDSVVGRELAEVGIGTRHCLPGVGGEPQITVVLAGERDRAFVTRRVGPPIPDLTLADLAGMGLGHLHIGELATLVERPGLIALAREAGLTVSLDCSWDDGLRADVAPLIAAVDVFLPNADEMARLAALGLSGALAPLTVIKQGAGGAMAVQDGREVSRTGPAVPVLDATGAGDAFNSGFLHHWLMGAPLTRCLDAGNACGAAAVQHRGGFGAAPVACRAG